MDSPNVLLIERLRKENLDQFLTLVRMHLSFVVDLNTDDVDCSTDKPKQFRWNFHKKIKNAAPSSSQQTNGNAGKNSAETNSITEEGILRLNELIDFLSLPESVTQEGIFRRTGSLTRQQELKQLLLTGSSLGLEEGRFSVHDCASVLKGFLAELPQPLLMDQYYQTYCTLAVQYPPAAESSEPKLLTALQLLLLLLAPLHRDFLQRLLALLSLVADNEASNRMSPDTLATMFTPHLLCPRKLSPSAFHADAIALSPLISFMIRAAARLWRAPPRLATDARAYFSARRRLDESVSDKTAANTVFTFVDRGRSAAEHSSNPTDTALAQLYAHIQALPDSAHKRRLIKHFNRQNGYGTPIQIQRTGKVAGSRSFGDSIKRHIFNKGLLNKTPKKGSGSINSIEEESIMTPRSRKPLIITCEQRDVACERDGERYASERDASERDASEHDAERDASERDASKRDATCEQSALEMARDNDSDFVSSDDDTRSTFSCERSINTSIPRSRTFEGRSLSAGDISPLRSETTRFILTHPRPLLQDLNATLEPPRIIVNQIERPSSLTEPFREYLHSRSVLTATPVDLSFLNNSKDKEISDSLLYCLDGNVPSDLTSSIGNLAVNNELRSPLQHVNSLVESPNRKRASSLVCKHEDIGAKKALVEKENVCEPIYEIRETDL